jgi:predicted Zn finger-like uncharacterized protein
MIVTCPNCEKKFKINHSLIPFGGRDLKCGSCSHIWFFNAQDIGQQPLSLNKDIDDNNIDSVIVKDKIEIRSKKLQSSSKSITKKNEKVQTKEIIKKPFFTKDEKKENVSNKFFSYLIVFIISFGALIILLDTLKKPLVNILPGLEIFLFNLYEILKDIKLFIIDLY